MTTRSWEAYWLMFLAGVLSLGIPLFLTVLARALGRFRPKSGQVLERSEESKPSRKRSGELVAIGQRMNVRFFLAAGVALTLIGGIIPLVAIIPQLHSVDAEIKTRAAVVVTVLTLTVAFALFYASKKGDLEWTAHSRGSRRKG